MGAPGRPLQQTPIAIGFSVTPKSMTGRQKLSGLRVARTPTATICQPPRRSNWCVLCQPGHGGRALQDSLVIAIFFRES
jgi:hypothetical protein